MSTAQKIVEQVVELGFDELTRYYGHQEWVNDIPLDELNVQQDGDCVLGHLFGSYQVGLARIFEPGQITYLKPVSCGFDRFFGTPYSFRDLTEAWKKRITRARLELAA